MQVCALRTTDDGAKTTKNQQKNFKKSINISQAMLIEPTSQQIILTPKTTQRMKMIVFSCFHSPNVIQVNKLFNST